MSLDPSKFNLGVQSNSNQNHQSSARGSNPFDHFGNASSGPAGGGGGGFSGFQDAFSNQNQIDQNQNDFSNIFNLKTGKNDWLKNSE